MKKAIIVGATSGIGKELAFILISKDYKVGITGRRSEILQQMEKDHSDNFTSGTFDLKQTETIIPSLEILVKKLGGLDLLIISSGTGDINEKLDFKIEKETIDVNVTGFTCIVDWCLNFFLAQGSGHLVSISSIGGLRGSRHAPAYNASKAFQINYLEGMMQKVVKLNLPILITDVRPGFVDTAMAKGEGKFWVTPVEKAARQIFKSISKKDKIAYVSRRWRLIAMLFKILPKWIYLRLQ